MRKIALEYSLRRGDKRHWGPITCTFRMFNFSLHYAGGELKQPHSKTAVGVIGSLVWIRSMTFVRYYILCFINHIKL